MKMRFLGRFYSSKIMLMAVFVLAIPSISFSNDLMCEWFGIGCPTGSSNEALIDLGRKSTNQGFLFFNGDSARIHRRVEFSFSEESVKNRDRAALYLTKGLLPTGSVVLVNGKRISVKYGLTIIADSRRKVLDFLWIIPPTGKDIQIDGSINLVPHGFERIGNKTLSESEKNISIPMLRIQGEVNNDWHWFKRLVFWLATILSVIVVTYKFFLAPVFLYRRLGLLGLRVELFEEGKNMPVWEHDFRRSIYSARKAFIGRKVSRPGWISAFMKGRVVFAESVSLPEGTTIEIDRGKRKELLGKKIQVKYGPGLVNSIYENGKPEERKIHLPNSKLKMLFHLK
jgi:hypothetical protein